MQAHLFKKCKIEGCDRNYHAIGYCRSHYIKYRNGDKKCTVEGCKQPHFAKGYCQLHYQRSYNHQEIIAPKRYEIIRLCSVSNCDKKHYARDYCQYHYRHLWIKQSK